MSRRIWVNLGLFGILFMVLLWWDLNDVLRIDAIKRPYAISAEFASSPGLRSGFGVSYLGVTVGRIGSVKLIDHAVEVQLKIDRGVTMPAHVDAKVRRRSAVGEPYIDLSPTGGTDPGGPRLKAGAHIPLSRTSTPIEYSEVFDTIANVVNKLPIDDVNKLLQEVAAGIDGRADDFRTIIASSGELAKTLADNSPLLDQLAGDLTTLTHTIASHGGSLGQGIDNVATLAKVLDEQRDHFGSLLDQTPSFVNDVNALLRNSGSNIGCIFDSGASLWSSIDQPEILSALDQLVSIAPQATDVVHNAAFQGPDGFYLNGTLVILLDLAPAPREYNPPLRLPAAPAIPGCNAPARSGSNGALAGTASGGSSSNGPGDHGLNTPARPSAPAAGHEASSKRHTKGLDLGRYLVPALIAIALTAALALFTMRPWRRLLARGRRGGS